MQGAHSFNYEIDDIFLDDSPKTTTAKRRQKKDKKQASANLKLRHIEPKTENQEKVFDFYEDEYNLMLHGCAGTGKTFISSYLAIADILDNVDNKKTLHIVRSVVPTRDMGFLPGNMREKSAAYEAPYNAIFTQLFGRGDAYETLKQKGQVAFTTTSFMRGLTFDDSIIIVDECQNLTFHELDSVITRIGDNTRVLFCGDFTQSDFKWDDEKDGILKFMKVIRTMKQFRNIEFNREDIVRSSLVKEYICAKLDLGVS